MLEGAWGCRLQATGRADRADFIAFRDGARVAEVEVKVKRGVSTRHPHFYIDTAKVEALTSRALRFGSTPIFVAQFDDGAWWIDVRRVVSCDTVTRGRRDRGDRYDQDEAFCVPRRMMRRLPW